MIFTLIAIAILIYALTNYKKAFLVFLIFRVFIDGNIRFSLPGMPSFITIFNLMAISLILLFFCNKHKLRLEKQEFPLKVPFFLVSTSCFISTIFSIVGFQETFMSYVNNIAINLALIYIMWYVIKDKRDILFLLKWFTIVFLIIAIYGCVEKITLSNPLLDYKTLLAGYDERMYGYNSDYLLENSVRGYRVSSCFAHPIGAGINFGLYCVMALIMIVKYNWKFYNIELLTATLCALCVFFANSRSCLLFLLIGCLSFIDLKNSKFNKLFGLLIIAGILLAPYLASYSKLFSSLFNPFDSNIQSEVGGSGVDMRLGQLYAVLDLWSQSPIWGLGFNFQTKISGYFIDAALGFESIWFVSLVRYGLLGTIAHIVLMYHTLIKIPFKYKSQSIFFVSLAYWATMSATTAPALMEYYYYLIVFIIVKVEVIYSKNKQLKKNEILHNDSCL